jgi:3-oxoacyl-ACP reductase-like protein
MITARFSRGAVAVVTAAALCVPLAASAQQSLQQKVAQVKQMIAANNQQLARYTWQMDQTVAVNGDVKDETLYQVQFGPGGTPVKTELSQSSSGGSQRQHGLRHHIEENYKTYAENVGQLAASYVRLDPSRLQQLYAQGNVAVRGAGVPGYTAIVISNYAKQGDQIVITFSNNPKALVSYDVASYLRDPSDGVTEHIGFASLPDGTRYPSTVTVNGQSKSMRINQTNSNFQLRSQ